MSTPDGLPPLREVIRELGLSAKKSLGQNFLLDFNLTRRIARASGPLEGVNVVEVGPGPGGLTRALLLEGAGHVVAIEERPRREASAREAMDRLLSTVRMIRDAGLPCDIVSAGGTGTYDITGRIDGVTEIQAGSYVLMDTAYARLDIPFEQAISLLGTVLSRPSPTVCVADCGH